MTRRMMMATVLLMLMPLDQGCDQLTSGIFGSDNYAVYKANTGDECYVLDTTGSTFGNKISRDFTNRNDAVTAGCQLVHQNVCGVLKNGTQAVACP